MKTYTDIGQSKKLAEILPRESADLWWDWFGNPLDDVNDGEYSTEPLLHKPVSNPRNIIPCWSLAALLEQIPSDLHSAELNIEKDDSELLKYGLYYHDTWGREDDIQTKYYENLVDACVEMILKLYEKKTIVIWKTTRKYGTLR